MFNEHDDEFFVFMSPFVWLLFFFFGFRLWLFSFIWKWPCVNCQFIPFRIIFFVSYVESCSDDYSNCFWIVIESDSWQRYFILLQNETKWHRVPRYRYQAPSTESQQWNDLQWINCLIVVRLYYCAHDECVKWSENRWDYSNSECD